MEKSVISELVRELYEDPEYRSSWKANIAYSFLSEYHAVRGYDSEIADIAERAAENFMVLLMGTKFVNKVVPENMDRYVPVNLDRLGDPSYNEGMR
jgi:hypothetical protein